MNYMCQHATNVGCTSNSIILMKAVDISSVYSSSSYQLSILFCDSVLVVQFSISASIIPCWHMSHVIRYPNVNNVWIIFDPKIILSLNLQHKQQFIVMLQPFKRHNMECCIKLNQRSVGSSPLSSQLSGVNILSTLTPFQQISDPQIQNIRIEFFICESSIEIRLFKKLMKQFIKC